jgi:putative component of toxin-antitoxin plasmid stabilization module
LQVEPTLRTPHPAAYDGRATKEENWFERTGLARLTGRKPGDLEQTDDGAVADTRYLDVVSLHGGGYRIYYEGRCGTRTTN